MTEGAPGQGAAPAAGAIDSHCHLADDAFKGDVRDVVTRARAAMPTTLCILDAASQDERVRAKGVLELWPEARVAVGVHPHNADRHRQDPAGAARVVEQALELTPRVCAIGEMGLDYHYDFAARPLQQKVFAAQIAVARARNLPIIVHTREADDDTMRILRAAPGGLRGVLHCFTGDLALARAALDLGFYISFSGIVSFPNSAALRAVAAQVPEDRLLVETDSPYLAPVPLRGKRNEPAFVVHVAEALAVARRTTAQAIVERTAANFQALFGAW
jgi:TatD DNase family protein